MKLFMLGYIRKKDAPEVIYYKDSRRSYNCVVGIGDYLFKDNQISIPPSSREYLDKVDWCIVIGCHYIWYEDILDFIKYYKLEKDFGI